MNRLLARLRSPAALLPAAMAVVLLALGLPQTAASLELLYAGGIAELVGPVQPASPQAAVDAAGILEAVDRRFDDSWARLRAGTLRLFLGYYGGRRPNRGQLTRAVADLDDGLARAPAADPVAWMALAAGRLGLGGRDPAQRALEMSMRLAPYDPSLALWRSELGSALVGTLDAAGRRLWIQQVRTAWDESRPELVAFARANPAAMANFTLALASDPELLRDFEEAVSAPR